METWKIGSVEVTEKELKEKFFNQNKKFLVSYRTIYQIFYNENSGFSYHKLYVKNDSFPFTKRGRYFITNAETVNNWVGYNLLVD